MPLCFLLGSGAGVCARKRALSRALLLAVFAHVICAAAMPKADDLSEYEKLEENSEYEKMHERPHCCREPMEE